MISRHFPKSKPLAAAGFIASLITVIVGVGGMIPKYGRFGLAFTVIAGLLVVYYGCALLMKKDVKTAE